MRLPQARYVKPKSKPMVITFKGYNNNPVVGSGELKDCSNLSTKNFPCLSPRPPRYANNTLSSGNALFTANGVLCWVDGTDFKYNGATKGTVTAGAKSMVDFNGIILIFPDKKYYNYGTNTFGTLGSGTYPTAGAVPDMDYVCTHQNRVFGVKNNTVYMCALGNANDWTTFAGVSTDAGATTISQVKTFTGIAAYQQHVMLFTANETLELYGLNPPYTVKEAFKKGCVDNKSVKEVNGILYFLSQDGFNTYGGGLPQLASDNLNEVMYSSCVAGTDGRKYYASLYNGTSYKLFVYDTIDRVWLKEDTLQVKDFAYLGGYLYALASDHKVYKFNYSTETVASEIQTEVFDEYVNNKKVYSKVRSKIDLETGASIAVYVSIDGGAYALVNTYTTTSDKTISANIVPRRCDRFQIKFVCSGEYKIYNLERYVTNSGS